MWMSQRLQAAVFSVFSFGSTRTAPTANGFIYGSTSRGILTPCSTRRSSTPAPTGKSITVEAEPPGFVVIYRYREAPHLRVSFANDFSKRLELQPGTKVVYARTNIDSDRDQVKKLYLG
jgi:hypothetical protein